MSGGDKPEDNALYTAGRRLAHACRAASPPCRAWAPRSTAWCATASISGLLPGPRILTSLRQINERSGDPAALRALVRRTKAEGADVIKLFATTGLGAGGNQSMSDEQIQAVCGEAKALGLRTVVHAIGDAGAQGRRPGRLHVDRARHASSTTPRST